MNIFISYNHQNTAFVSSITQKIKGEIIILKELFFDQDNLEGGQVWTDAIQQALLNSDACIVFIGEQGIGNWQNKEVLTAVNKYVDSKGGFKLIPVIIPHSDRTQVQKNMPWFLSDIQWIEFLNESDPDAFLKLTTRLNEGEIKIDVPAGTIPYKGLDFFEVADAPFFFGRTFDVNWIFYKKLTLDIKTSSRFLAIVGDSGSGKSSFARAGILATLKAGRFKGSTEWKHVIFSPEDNPLLKLSTSLQSAGIISDAKKMEDESKTDNTSLRRALENKSQRVVLLVDQFEEVVTQCKDNLQREVFLKNIIEALKSQYLVCIITMRSDFYAAFSPFREFAELLETNNYTITNLDFNTASEEWTQYLRDIIQKPAKLMGVSFDAVLTNQIIEDCKGINGILPALQLALVELWKKGVVKQKIESSDYDSLANGKGIAGIIEAHANNIWKILTKEESDKHVADLIKAIFIRLVEITGNKEDVRKTVNKTILISELEAQFNQTEIEKTLDILSGTDARLIRVKRNTASGNTSWVEVIHEALIRQWDKLRVWLNERRDAIIYKNKLEQYIDDDNKLLTGKKLFLAEQWITNNKDLTNHKINNFVKESRTNVNKRKHVLTMFFAAIILLSISAWLYYPVYQCKSCSLVKIFENGNADINDIRTLSLVGTTDIKNMRCFKNLDSLTLQSKEGDDYLSKASFDMLPADLKYLYLDGFAISDTILRFEKFSQLKVLKISSIKGLRKISINKMDSLTDLDLSSLENFKDPSSIEGINNLQTLTLSGFKNLLIVHQAENLKGLKSLNIFKVPLQGLEDILNISGLRDLCLTDLNITSLEGIENFKNLQNLELSGVRGLSNIKVIENLKNLRTLNLNLRASLLPEFENLKNLQTLSLAGLRISDVSLIKNLENLQNLTLSDLDITSLAGMENFKKLQSLNLSSLQKIENLDGIERLESLKSLDLNTITISKLDGIEKLPLKELHIYNLVNLDTLEAIKNIKTLTNLSLKKLGLPIMAAIVNLDSLQKLTLSELNDSSLAGIEKLKKLQVLDISYLSIPDLTNIGNLKSLTSLTASFLYKTSLTGIEKMKNLLSLTLSDLSNSNLDGIENETALQTLSIHNLKLENLDFLNKKSSIKTVLYDNTIPLPNRELEFKKKATQMKQTKFLNLSTWAMPEMP